MLKKNYSKKKNLLPSFWVVVCFEACCTHTIFCRMWKLWICKKNKILIAWKINLLYNGFSSVPCSVLHSECETSPSQMLSHSLFLCPGPVKQMKANRKLSSLLYVISEPSPGKHATLFVLFGLTLYTIYVNRLYLQSPILMHLLLVHTF